MLRRGLSPVFSFFGGFLYMDYAVYLLLLLELLGALLLLKTTIGLKSPAAWVVSVLLLLLAFGARAYVFPTVFIFSRALLPAARAGSVSDQASQHRL